jgi:hypothetical protein
MQVGTLPWTVIREGATLHVSIRGPIHDWNPLLARLVEEVDGVGSVAAITLPAVIPYADARDRSTLNALWAILIEQGIAIHRDVDPGRPEVVAP